MWLLFLFRVKKSEFGNISQHPLR